VSLGRKNADPGKIVWEEGKPVVGSGKKPCMREKWQEKRKSKNNNGRGEI